MKWAILLYAILLYPDGEREQHVISWNIPFLTYQQCQVFFLQNATTLKDGVVVHGNSRYEQGMTLSEMGCTKAFISANGKPLDNPADRLQIYKLEDKGQDI